MFGVPSRGHVIMFGPPITRLLLNSKLNETILVGNQQRGANDLTRICNELEEKRQSWQTKADNYETALKRAEARIAYLNKKLGIGPQTTFGIDVVNPGISRKDFDAVTKENIRLKEALEHIAPTELGGKNIVIVNENATASATNAISNEEQGKMVEEKEKVILEQAAKIQDFLTKIEDASKRITELSTEVAKTNKEKQKTEFELSETAKKCSDFQKKSASSFNQVVSLNSKQQESEEEISSLKRECENLRAQVAEKDAMMVMMRDSLKAYADDFRRENEEKAGFQKRMETAQQESERLRRANQSHMATIRHFESEIERMSKLLTDEKNRNKNTTSFQTSIAQRCGSNVSRNFFELPTQEEGAFSETIEQKERIISEQRTQMDQMQKEKENLLKQVAELTSERLGEKPRAHGAERKGIINMMGFQYLANCTFAN